MEIGESELISSLVRALLTAKKSSRPAFMHVILQVRQRELVLEELLSATQSEPKPQKRRAFLGFYFQCYQHKLDLISSIPERVRFDHLTRLLSTPSLVTFDECHQFCRVISHLLQ
jgi:hypothetical protein